jgi:hypothetical protein
MWLVLISERFETSFFLLKNGNLLQSVVGVNDLLLQPLGHRGWMAAASLHQALPRIKQHVPAHQARRFFF